MDVDGPRDLSSFFSSIPDPRRYNRRHLLTDILAIALMAVLCRCDDWADVEAWALANQPWLEELLCLPHGIPAADTFERVFARLDPAAVERCLLEWSAALSGSLEGKVVSIDGKTLRGSFQTADRASATHMVSAWCDHHRLSLAQLACDGKSNEITAIPRLMELLCLKGAIITIDAIGCQKQIAHDIVKQKAHYILAVKDNQRTLHEEVKFLMDEGIEGKFDKMPHSFHEATEGDHGRVEVRKCWVTCDIGWYKERKQWEGLKSVACVECTRHVDGGGQTVERRYFITTFDAVSPGQDARTVLDGVRTHWGIENRLHWSLDVTFREDQSRARKENHAQNLSRIRRLALNLVSQDKSGKKQSLKVKRFRCSLDRNYLIKTLARLHPPAPETHKL
jgi:predicted transposase YbfD/YdcC